MKQVILNIPDNKYEFFMELINNLGFEWLEETDIPEEHKTIVRERIKTAKSEDFVTWEEARKTLSKK